MKARFNRDSRNIFLRALGENRLYSVDMDFVDIKPKVAYMMAFGENGWLVHGFSKKNSGLDTIMSKKIMLV